MNTAPDRHALRGSLDALPLFIPALPFAFVFGVVVAGALALAAAADKPVAKPNHSSSPPILILILIHLCSSY